MLQALLLAGILAAPLGSAALFVPTRRGARGAGTWPAVRRSGLAVIGTAVLAAAVAAILSGADPEPGRPGPGRFGPRPQRQRVPVPVRDRHVIPVGDPHAIPVCLANPEPGAQPLRLLLRLAYPVAARASSPDRACGTVR